MGDLFDSTDALLQMGHHPIFQTVVHAFRLGHKSVDLGGAFVETRFELAENRRVGGHRQRQLLALHVLQVLHGHFQDVGFLQFRVSCRLR
jgi:hypothetical protein